MRVIFKIFSMPIMVVLSITVAVLSFLASIAGSVLKFLSVPAALLGGGIAIFGDTAAGLLILAGAFLISPFGLPLLANWILDRMADLNFTLRDFITS